jgi:hypothetical protein
VVRLFYPDFSESIISAYKFLNGKYPKTQQNRFPKNSRTENIDLNIKVNASTGSKSKKEKKSLDEFEIAYPKFPIQFDDIHVCEVYDVMDRENLWYTAQVIEKSEDKFKVSYDGWTILSDESFTRMSCVRKIAKFGSITGGIAHASESICKCVACIDISSR